MHFYIWIPTSSSDERMIVCLPASLFRVFADNSEAYGMLLQNRRANKLRNKQKIIMERKVLLKN